MVKLKRFVLAASRQKISIPLPNRAQKYCVGSLKKPEISADDFRSKTTLRHLVMKLPRSLQQLLETQQFSSHGHSANKPSLMLCMRNLSLQIKGLAMEQNAIKHQMAELARNNPKKG